MLAAMCQELLRSNLLLSLSSIDSKKDMMNSVQPSPYQVSCAVRIIKERQRSGEKME